MTVPPSSQQLNGWAAPSPRTLTAASWGSTGLLAPDVCFDRLILCALHNFISLPTPDKFYPKLRGTCEDTFKCSLKQKHSWFLEEMICNNNYMMLSSSKPYTNII